jgi:hypothetical protein
MNIVPESSDFTADLACASDSPVHHRLMQFLARLSQPSPIHFLLIGQDS